MKSLKKLYTFFAILVALSCWSAAVDAQTVRMPDAGLAEAMRYTLGLAPNAPITQQALQSLSSFSNWDRMELGQWYVIKDLTGLEYATNLTELSLGSWEEIRDLGPLASLTKLESLDIVGNPISDFRPLTGLTRLRSLRLTVDRIGDIQHLSSLPSLVSLTIANIGSPVSQLNLLKEFKQLKSLEIVGAQISDLRFVSGLTQLEGLDLEYNRITDVSPLANLTQLKWLILRNNQITDVSPLAGLTRLELLYLSGNPILDTSPLANLLNLYRASRTDIFIPWSPSVISAPPPVIPDEILAAVVRDALGLAPDAPITRQALKKLTSLRADRWQIEQVIGQRDVIRNLAIRDLTGLEHATKLTKLLLSESAVHDLRPLAGLTQLTELNIAYNPSRNFRPLTRLTQLQSLTLTVDRIGDIQYLSSLPLVSLEIWKSATPVRQLNLLKEFKELKHLSISTAHISNLGFVRGLTQLESLDLYFNEIKNLSPLTDLTQLESLGLVGNEIRDVSPLAGLTRLEALYLSENQIRDVSPLAGLTRLEALYLEGNPISDTSPLAKLPKLTEVDIGISQPVENIVPDDQSAINLKSPAGGPETEIIFVNNTKAEITYYWVDFDGNEAFYGTIAPDDSANQGTYEGHIWVIKDVNGNNLAVFHATEKTERMIVSASHPVVAVANLPVMYWIDGGMLYRLAGDTVENIVPEVQNATNLAIDMKNNKVYWTEMTGKRATKIQRANLDGSNVKLIKNRANVIRDIALDTTNGKLYMTNGFGKVQRMNLDGSKFQANLITDLQSPNHLALDIKRSKIYWTEQRGNKAGKIRRANLDGTNIKLLRDLTNRPHGLGIDNVNAKMYLTNAYGKVQRMNLGGSKFQANFITDLDAPGAVTVDVAGAKLYWVAAGKIQRANLNGKNVEDVVTSLATPTDIVLGIPPANAATPAAPRIAPVLDQTLLLPNYPNPFNPETWVPYHLAKPADVRLTIYGIDGKVVRRLDLGHQAAGFYQSKSRAAYWDGRNDVGERVASGIYFYTLTAGEFAATQKMLILK